MRHHIRLAVAGAILLLAGAGRAEAAPGLEGAFAAAAWTRLPADAAVLPAAHARVVSYEGGADPGLTLDHLLNGGGRPALEAILRDGGAVFVRGRAGEAAFTGDPMLALQLACSGTGRCPGFAAFTASASGLVVVGGEVAGGYLLAAPAAPGALAPPLLRAGEGARVPELAVGLPGAVPEPANWALLILGFALVGVAARRGPILSGQPLPR